MQEIFLDCLLKAREDRAKAQKNIINKYRCPLICFTMNIAGPIKNTPLIERSFYYGLQALEENIEKGRILYKRVNIYDTGCEAYLSVDMPAASLKEICVSIEEASLLGRLFDMDVLDINASKLERKSQRGCIVCGSVGRVCAARRLHSVTELQNVTNKILNDHFYLADRDKISTLAVESLIKEVNTTVKPGLVDRRNSGSHSDMDINTFIASAYSLAPYFSRCVAIGQENIKEPLNEVFKLIRKAGKQAEKDMYEATNGINTHKGIIYSLGVICTSIGLLWTADKPFADVKDILNLCGKLVKESVKQDLASIDESTAGGYLYRKYKITGIRGEAADGFPSVFNIGLPNFLKSLNNGLSSNDAGVVTLLHLICTVKDTNLYHRGGIQGAKYAVARTKTLLDKFTFPPSTEIEALDDDFIKRDLSPGGCADLLAITYFLHSLTEQK